MRYNLVNEAIRVRVIISPDKFPHYGAILVQHMWDLYFRIVLMLHRLMSSKRTTLNDGPKQKKIFILLEV